MALENKMWSFISDPVNMDMFTYSMWLTGTPVSRAAKSVASRYNQNPSLGFVDEQTFLNDVEDQYRNFELLRPHLAQPITLEQNLYFHIEPSLVSALIERYYEFDDAFIRDTVGKRLSNKLRDHLDEMAERLRLSSASCHRQFDNLRRVYKRVVSMNHVQRALPVVDVITNAFRLSRELSEFVSSLPYARAIFLVYHRFEVKKSLPQALYSDLDDVSHILLSRWTVLNQKSENPDFRVDRVWSVHLQPKFTSRLRDLKTLLMNTRDSLIEYSNAIKPGIHKSIDDNKKSTAIDNKLFSILKHLLHIAASLSQAKAFKDVLADTIEHVVETCKRMDLTKEEVESVIIEMETSFHKVVETFVHTVPKHRENLEEAWVRFLEGVRLFVLRVYDSVSI